MALPRISNGSLLKISKSHEKWLLPPQLQPWISMTSRSADPSQSRDSRRTNQALLKIFTIFLMRSPLKNLCMFFFKITINGKYFTSNSSPPINSLFKVKFQCWSLTSIRNLLPGRRVQQVVYRTPALLSRRKTLFKFLFPIYLIKQFIAANKPKSKQN